jgi:nucleotide-binding universal stress UspA family protein
MTYRRILVPTDGSDRGHVALDRALDLAKALGADVTGLYVVDETSYMGLPAGFDWQALSTALREEGQRALAEVEERARAAGVRAETRLVEGHPAERIVEAGKDHDLIVMGTLGRSGLAHLLLGSVAERVIRHAPCPVMAVRVPASAP